MLYSHAANVAFAHYPKTAGAAIAEWFRRSFPDAEYLRPGQPHADVRRSLARLSGRRSPALLDRMRHFARAGDGRLTIEPRPGQAAIRIIGVVREPLDVLESLYRSWRRERCNPAPGDRLVTAAWEGRFEAFVRLAIAGRLPTYERFFDAGGPAWPNTRLLHFADVEVGLARVCREFGIPVPVGLPRTIRGHGPAGPTEARRIPVRLEADVRRHFAWYHATFGHAEHPAARRRPPTRLVA